MLLAPLWLGRGHALKQMLMPGPELEQKPGPEPERKSQAGRVPGPELGPGPVQTSDTA